MALIQDLDDPGRRWRDAKRILAVRLDALGDVLMTAPALEALAAGPARPEVTLLASPAGAAAARLVPAIAATIRHEASWMKHGDVQPDGEGERALIRRLRDERFDAGVVFTVHSQNPLPAALLLHLADVPMRLAHCRENPYQLLTHWARETEPATPRHEVQRQLDLVSSVGFRARERRIRLHVPAHAHERADAELARAGVRGPWVLVHAGATAPSRRYPEDRFAVAARGLVAAGLTVVFSGSADEAPLVERILGAVGAPTVSLVGRTDVVTFAALVRRAPLLLSNNTSAVHLAAGVGTPVVVLYALTNLQHTPWQVRSRVLSHPVSCSPCYRSVCPEIHHLCLAGVSPDVVVAACLELLDKEPATVAGIAEPW